MWRLVAAHAASGAADELDLGEALDALATRADAEPSTYRWSYTREYDSQVRLVVVDSRAARQLDPDDRALLDADEAAWLDEQLRGDVDHLLIAMCTFPDQLSEEQVARRLEKEEQFKPDIKR